MSPDELIIYKSYRSLWPTGRAFNYVTGPQIDSDEGNVFTDAEPDYFTDGAGNLFSDGSLSVQNKNTAWVRAKIAGLLRRKNAVDRLLDQKHPGSEYYEFEDTKNWERIYGIVPRTGSTEQDRESAIAQRLSYPNGVQSRGYYGFIETQLRNAGFDVYVHENRFPSTYRDSQCGTAQCGVDSCDGNIAPVGPFESRLPEPGYTEVVANYLDPVEDAKIFDPAFGNACGTSQCGVSQCETDYTIETNYSSCFFICAENYPDFASVPSSRREEFRQITLKYKPAHAYVLTYINYID